jgi:hypothetical protein
MVEGQDLLAALDVAVWKDRVAVVVVWVVMVFG